MTRSTFDMLVDKGFLGIGNAVTACSKALAESKWLRIQGVEADTRGKVEIVALLYAINTSACASDPKALQALTIRGYHQVRKESGALTKDRYRLQSQLHKASPDLYSAPAGTLKGAGKKGTQPIARCRRDFENYLEVKAADPDMAEAQVAPFKGTDGESSWAERSRTLASTKDGRVTRSRQQIRMGRYLSDGRNLAIPVPDEDAKEWNGSTTDKDGVEWTSITVGSKDNEETIKVAIGTESLGKLFKELAEEQRSEDIRGSIRKSWVRDMRDSFTPVTCIIPAEAPKKQETSL